jgi:hypothetical protein
MDTYSSGSIPDQRHLTDAVEDSQDLLRYAARSGIAVPPDVIARLVHARSCLDTGRVPEETAVAFYAALSTLARLVAPVTVDTLRTSSEKTRAALSRNGMFAVVLALVVVVLSGIGSITGAMSRDIDTALARANELAVQLRGQVGAPAPGVPAGCLHDPGPPVPPIAARDETPLIQELQDFSSTIRTMLRTAAKLDTFIAGQEINPLDVSADWRASSRDRLELHPDLINMRNETFCKIETYQDVRDFAQNVNADSRAFYGALSAYLLPVLYALLGACAYNLRDFSTRVKRRTYHPSSYANTARTIAAMTAGAIISLFNIFNRDNVLQPLAVAFLVGYGVEVFFAFLDSLLIAFSNRGRPAPGPAAS